MESTEQVVIQPVIEKNEDDLVNGFFAIGMILNILLIVAYGIWAFKQWGKKEKSQ